MKVLRGLAGHLWLALVAPVAVAVLATVIVSWAPWAGHARVERTNIRLFDPNGEIGPSLSAFKIVGRGSGTCSSWSIVDPAPFVVRCSSRDRLMDACFGAYQPDLLCVGDPWTHDAFALHVRRYYFDVGKAPNLRSVSWNPTSATEPLPTEAIAITRRTRAFVTQLPWALELANGQRCVSTAGATGLVAGLRANFDCSRSGESSPGEANLGWVVGKPDRSSEPWTVEYIRTGSPATTQVAVVAAWF